MSLSREDRPSELSAEQQGTVIEDAIVPAAASGLLAATTEACVGVKRPREPLPPTAEADGEPLSLSHPIEDEAATLNSLQGVELVVTTDEPMRSTVPLRSDFEPPASVRRGDAGAFSDSSVSSSRAASFPSAPVSSPTPPTPSVVKVPVPSPQQLSATPCISSGSGTATPSSWPPVRIPRKTPVSTPASSAAHTPASLPSGSFSTSSVAPIDPKRVGRIERWADLLLPAMMQGCEPHEEGAKRDLCRRIAGAISGDRQEAKDTFLMLLVNLKDEKNAALRVRLATGELPVEVLVALDERDLVNPERRKKLDEEFEERAKDTNLVEIRKAAMTSSTMFPCPRCKVRDCSWTQKQTRSADEPMTVFCFCNKCSYVWKKY